ncbi:MAG: hypothetical protein ACH346_08635, partial [Chthoniobacterales bacterium]
QSSFLKSTSLQKSQSLSDLASSDTQSLRQRASSAGTFSDTWQEDWNTFNIARGAQAPTAVAASEAKTNAVYLRCFIIFTAMF